MSQELAAKLKLMVVDDEPDNLDLLYRTFRRDFRVFKADNGFRALEALEEYGEMAIIISDQRMPRMNGTEFLGRTVERFPDTIRIVLTGYTDVEDLVEAINSGKVFKYITKPWNPDQLKSVVVQAAETYRVLKQRTLTLRRALRRESLLNDVMRAIRESLDYASMLQTIAETLGKTFEAHQVVLRPVETISGESPQYHLSDDCYIYTAESVEPAGIEILEQTYAFANFQSVVQRQEIALDQSTVVESAVATLTVPLIYQKNYLAIAGLHRLSTAKPWTEATIDLLQSVSEQIALAISQAMLYQRIQAQTEQMRAELAVARQIQTNLLRQSWPQIDGLRIQARCRPAREVGGDFFEVFVHPQGDIWLAVGDVSGKGVPAALFMASAISVLRRELSQELPPEPNIVMQNLNAGLSDDLVGNNCFITMVLARYTPSQHHLVYANAGHVYPVVWHQYKLTADPSSTAPSYLDKRGVPLGILPIWQAAAGEIELPPGHALLITSDGITEASVAEGDHPNSTQMLQQTGLWELLKKQSQPLDLDKLLSQLEAFHAEQEDDQTILALEVL
ncbi:MAG: SpoIIE family protein phosphatase [Cyanobacteria bacterium P01_A01_bin.123]